MNSWVLIRASNTEPVIRMTCEADTKEELEIIRDYFSKIIRDEIKRGE